MRVDRMSVKDLEACITGGCFLGSGGGGNVSIARKLLNSINLKDPNEDIKTGLIEAEVCDSEKLTAVVAFIGSPDSFKDGTGIKPVVHAFKQLQEKIKTKSDGKEIGYLIPAELGAVNTLVSLLTAHTVNKECGETLLVVDGDGAGRAVPQLPMTTFAAEKVSANPAILSNADGFFISLESGGDSSDNTPSQPELLESVIRPILSLDNFDGVAGLALWVMDYKQLQSSVIKNSVSSLLEIGEYLNSNSFEDINEKDLLKLYQKFVPNGEIETITAQYKEIENITEGGFDHGVVKLKEGDTDYQLLFVNETIITWSSKSDSPIIKSPSSSNLIFNQKWDHFFSDDSYGRSFSKYSGIPLSNGDIQEQKSKLSDCSVKLFKCSPVKRLTETPISEAYKSVLAQIGYYGE